MKDVLDDLDPGSDLRRITAAIWRDADFGAPVEDGLHRDVVLRAPEAIHQGRVAVATEALGQRAAFSDERWFPEDTLIAPSRGGPQVLADRRTVEARHNGPGPYGPSSGRTLRYRVLSEAAMKDARITELWRVADRGAILRALDLSPERWAAEALIGSDPDCAPLTPARDVPGAYSGRGEADGWGATWADLVQRAMEGAFALLEDQYDPGAVIAGPGGTCAYGPRAARDLWLGLRAALPSAQFEVHHRFGCEAPLSPPRAALRWSLTGRHDGWGVFGAPSGGELHVMGLSQAEFGPNGLRREWTLYDAGAVWMQILQARG